MQITDIHLGEAESTDWGPEQDRKTFKLLHKMFHYEQPDLVVLGGDQLTANNCLHNCTEYYKILGEFLSEHGVPWATVMGNHDDMNFESEGGTLNKTIPHSYTRRQLLGIDESFPLSLSKDGPSDVTGVTNYVLDILDPDTNQPAAQIFFLDSGGGTLPEAIDESQVRWFQAQVAKAPNLPAVAFQHIPTSSHRYSDACVGYHGDNVQEIQDGGIVDAIVKSGRFHFLGVGHNHGNDYCCPYSSASENGVANDLFFCFGRHSGYGGYGDWQRGVRMYELLLSESVDFYAASNPEKEVRTFKWRTWVSS
jgi:3',5'-cyclic AMP phosphodiesterase CpdA